MTQATQQVQAPVLTPEILNFLRMNMGAEPYHGLPHDYKEVEGKYKVVLVEDKISKYHIEKAIKDLDLIAKRIEARKNRTEILEGDVIEFLDGHTERVTHVWEDHAQAGGGSGSYYMGESGYGSYSGGLNSGLPLAELQLTDKTKECMFWFFSGNMSGGNRGVYFYCPVKVWKQIDNIKYNQP